MRELGDKGRAAAGGIQVVPALLFPRGVFAVQRKRRMEKNDSSAWLTNAPVWVLEDGAASLYHSQHMHRHEDALVGSSLLRLT